jgi:prepilin-type N-terminal cleavage/methylation domain-containing protein
MAMAAERAQRPRQRRSDAGFTLIELMIALFMLAIGILAVGRMFIMAQRHATYGRVETVAVSLAQEIREKMLSKDFDDLEALFDGVDTQVPGTVTAPCQLWAAHLATGLGATGRGRLTVRSPAEDPEIVDGMLTVLIDVSWLENGSTKSAAMHFSLSRMGV